MIKPYYEHAGITIYHGDCREIVPYLSKVDLLLTDPPYGMNWNTDSTRFSGGHAPSSLKRGRGRSDWGNISGDNQPFEPGPWLDYDRVILWGCNHYAAKLPPGTTLVWIKRFDSGFQTFLSDAELAWMKGGCGVYCRRDTSLLSYTAKRYHPSQKPVSLMTWCIRTAGLDKGSLLDPFMGSGTTLMAAKVLGLSAIGIEIEEHYCEIAVERLAQELLPLQGSLAAADEAIEAASRKLPFDELSDSQE